MDRLRDFGDGTKTDIELAAFRDAKAVAKKRREDLQTQATSGQ